jgi:hypothetical protein
VTVQTPPWWPTSVSPLSSWVVNTIWSPRAVPSKFCSVVSAPTVNVLCLSLSLDDPQAGLIAPTASARSAIAVLRGFRVERRANGDASSVMAGA